MIVTLKLGLDITGISELQDLVWLNLNSNINLNGYEEVFELKKLVHLFLYNDSIEKISGIKNLEQLETLVLALNSVSDISELENLKNTTRLELHKNEIEDISMLNIEQYTTKFTLENQNISKTIITENLNYEYPNIIKNAKLENNPIYSSEGLEFYNCAENTDGTGIILEANKLGQVRVKSGLAKGTILSITPIMKAITDIKVTKAPTKTNYIEGQSFDNSGMKVIATYNDGDTKEITNYKITDEDKDSLTEGKQEITISYTEKGVTKTTTQQIIVEKKTITGDVSENGDIDPNDYIAILRHIAAQADSTKTKWILSEEKQKIADVTGDGKIDLNDVIKIKRYIAAKNDANVAKAHSNWLNL